MIIFLLVAISRFELIFRLFDVCDIQSFNSKILFIKNEANLDSSLKNLNIDVYKNSEQIIKGINLLRLGNNPVKIDKNDIFKIISKSF